MQEDQTYWRFMLITKISQQRAVLSNGYERPSFYLKVFRCLLTTPKYNNNLTLHNNKY